MNPTLASLHYCLSRHPLPGWASAIAVAEQGGEAEQLATRAEYAAMRARRGVIDTPEEVTLRVLGVCLRWRVSGWRSVVETEAAGRHAERLIERSVLRRDKPCQQATHSITATHPSTASPTATSTGAQAVSITT